AVGVKMIINIFCDSFAYPSDALEFAKSGPRHRPRRAKMVQQRLFTASAYPDDLVERRSSERLGPPRTMRSDCKSVRFVTQALQEVEHRVPQIERKRRSSRYEETLAPGIAIRTLGDPHNREVRDTEFFENPLRDV